jgi:phosphoserine phosphatase
MNGELSYAESLRERVRLLTGLSDEAVTNAFEQVNLRPGGGALLRALAEESVTTAILTGGFHAGVEHALAAQNTKVTTIIANSLVSADGELTGEVTGPLVEGTKDDALQELVRTHNLSLDETIAVGDGANDIPMLDESGISIGFDPKQSVRTHCDHIVHSIDELSDLLTEIIDIQVSNE